MITRICAAGIAFLAFTLSLIIGLWVQNPFTTVVTRAVVMLFVFYIVGTALAWIGQKVILENFESTKQKFHAQAADPHRPDESETNQAPVPATGDPQRSSPSAVAASQAAALETAAVS